MCRTAIATLQTPWDCKWSRFGRMRSTRPDAPAEGLWVCVFPDGMTRRPIVETVCETCDCWEYNPPLTALAHKREQAQPAPIESHPTR